MNFGPITSAAIHEAGHALPAWYSPNIVDVKSVRLDGRQNGRVHCRWYDLDNSEAMWDFMTIMLSGAAAEILFNGRANFATAAFDLHGAQKAAEQLLTDDWSGLEGLPKHHMRRTARHYHPDFGPLERRLKCIPGTAGILHAAYRRGFLFLSRHKLKIIALASAIQLKKNIGCVTLFCMLGPRNKTKIS